MEEEIRACEEKMARTGGWAGSVLTSRATTALAAALGALRLERGRGVVMPVSVCANVVYAVKGAGLHPVFADVEVQKGGIGISEGAARRAIEKDGKCGALLAIPIFGGEVDWAGLLRLAADFGLIVIEDAAQVGLVRSTQAKRREKSPAVCSMVSFGEGKVGSAGGGGAVLSDDIELLESVKGRVGRGRYAGEARWGTLATKISSAIDGLENEVGQRLYMAKEYRRRLGGRVEHIGEALPVWKYSVLVLDRRERDRVTRDLLEQGVDATNLYPPLVRWFAGVDGESYSEASKLYERIVNLQLWGEKKEEIEQKEWMERTLKAVEKVF